MGETVYFLCTLTSLACSFLLLRGHFATGSRLLMWGGLCFGFLAVNNIVLIIDVVVLPEIDFHGSIWRSGIGACAGSLLLFGLIWELT